MHLLATNETTKPLNEHYMVQNSQNMYDDKQTQKDIRITIFQTDPRITIQKSVDCKTLKKQMFSCTYIQNRNGLRKNYSFMFHQTTSHLVYSCSSPIHPHELGTGMESMYIIFSWLSRARIEKLDLFNFSARHG